MNDMEPTPHQAGPPVDGATTSRRRHPIRGALWGVMLGIGAALLLIGQKLIAFGTLGPIIVLVVGIAVGVLWSMFAPSKAPKGPAPMRPQPAPPTTAVDPEPAMADPFSAGPETV